MIVDTVDHGHVTVEDEGRWRDVRSYHGHLLGYAFRGLTGEWFFVGPEAIKERFPVGPRECRPGAGHFTAKDAVLKRFGNPAMGSTEGKQS